MKKTSGQFLVTAAIAGIIGAASLVSTTASADEGDQKIHCMGANGCKGQSGCKTADNACRGQNGCEGKGFLEKTKKECEELAKKNKNIKLGIPS